MLRQSFGCCLHSMKKELTCRKCHGTYRQRRCSGVLLFGLLLCVIWPYGDAAVFTLDIPCSSDSFMRGTEKLQNITCQHLNLTAIPSDSKNGDDVIKFDLSHNLITLQDSSLIFFTRLAHLDLSFNRITTIPVGTFSNASSLTYLSLAGNNISEINEEIFTDSFLTFLDLSYNPLLTLPTRPDSSNLIVLNISHCNLISIESKLFDGLTVLEELDVSHNNITTLESNLFRRLSLSKINLSYNQIESKFIDRRFLNDGDSVTNLNLAHNKITSLENDIFEDTPFLEVLDISNNNLTSLPSHIFEKTSLKYLELNNNVLTSLPDDVFNEIKDTVQRIDLSDNSLTTLSPLWFADLVNVIIDLSNNPFVCDCATKEVLYTIFKTNSLINVDLTKCRTSDGTAEYVFMDYNNADCSGNLGSTCTNIDDCMVRNSKCSSTCICEDGYYDNNGVDTVMGLCKNKVDLDYPCDHATSCSDINAECVGLSATTCQCVKDYYDIQPLYFGGKCEPKKELGEVCTMNSMCKPSHSYCNSTDFCDCTSAYYDDTDTNNVGGTCLPKLALYAACTESYQCGTDNAECVSNVCTCKTGYYDLANNQKCLDIPVKVSIRQKRSSTSFENLCKRVGHTKHDCRPESFFSCYETESDDTEVVFSTSSELGSDDACEQNCFRTNMKYYVYVSGVCLCGDIKIVTPTPTRCCPKVDNNCDSRQYATKHASLASADISIGYVPLLYYGTPHEFTFSASLVIIDQVRISFGDSQALTNVSASSGAVYHTYSYPGKFWVSVYGCVQSVDVCERASIPVIVQVPPANLSTYITGIPKADVSESLTAVYATVPLGYNADFFWTKTSNGVVSKRQGCANGWLSHRTTCIKLGSAVADYSAASASCVSDGGRLLKLDYETEIAEVVPLLGASSSSFLLGAQKSGGLWKWQSDNSKTFFKDSDLTSSTNGNCLVVDGATNKLTSASCTASASYACMTDPVSCPYGGKLLNDYCYLLVTSLKSWSESQTYCSNQYGGWLAEISNEDTHTNITALLGAASVSDAWFGLNDEIHKRAYFWANGASYDLTNAPYQPLTTLADDGACFVTNNTNGWKELECTMPKNFVCQYSTHLDRITVPSYVTGITDLQIPSGDSLQQLLEPSSFPSTTASSYTVQLFPGMPFTRQGRIRYWAFRADIAADISLQHYVPKCTSGTLYQPGCASTMFATCSSNSHTCTASNTCQAWEKFCHLSNTCKSVNESCTCNSEASSTNAVNCCSSYGAAPTYELVGQTKLTVTSPGAYISAADISVGELDLIGIQYPTGSKVIKCDNIADGLHQQTSYLATTDHWFINSEQFPSIISMSNETCYLQAITSEDHWENLTAPLAFSSTVGNYGLSASIIGGVSRSLSIHLEETAEGIVWVYPQISEPNTTADSLGTIYTELNVENHLTIRVERGTDLTSVWTIDGATTTHLFSNSSDLSVEAAVPDACNASLYWSDLPCASLTYNSPAVGTKTLSIQIYNGLGTTTKTLNIRTEKRISGVSFSMTTPALQANNAAINKISVFETTVTDGTGLSYSYKVNGASVTAPTTNSSLWYQFTSLGTYTVDVTVTNILGSETKSVTVYAKYAADFTNCNSVHSNTIIAAVGKNLNLQVQCELNSGAEVSTAWKLSDRTNNITQAVSTVSSTPYTWLQTVQFSTVQTGISVMAYIMDPFESKTVSLTINVYNAIPDITLKQNITSIFPSDYVQFEAEVPTTPGNYGTVEFIYDFGDSTVVTYSVGTTIHRYMTGGNFTVKVTASNGPSNQSRTSYVTVNEHVTGLSLSNNGPKAVNTPIQFNATTAMGNFLNYRFESTLFNVTQSDPSYTFTFTVAMDYTIKVTAYNELSSQSVSVTAYILNTNELRISALTIDGHTDIGCFEAKTSKQFQIEIIFYDAKNVLYDWDFGNGITQLDVSDTYPQQYNVGSNYTITVFAKYAPLSIQNSIQKMVCVQERITNPSFSLTSPVALLSTGPVTKTVSVALGTGSNSAKYEWSTNATYSGSLTQSTLSVTFSVEGYYRITVNISNEINYVIHTSTIQVIESIDGLQITCAACSLRSGALYVLENNAYTFSLSSSSGSDLIIAWDFGDGTTGSGNDISHTYSPVGSYNITVTAANTVTTPVQTHIIVYVQKDITNVILLTYGTANWTTNVVNSAYKDLNLIKYATLKATVLPSGMDLLYKWKFEDGQPERISSNFIESYQYNTTGLKNVTVSAENEFGSKFSSSFQFYVIQTLTASSITENGTLLTSTNHMVLQDTLYKYTMSSSQIVDNTVKYTFILKRNGVIESSKTDQEFLFTFNVGAAYTLKGTIQNSLGSFAQDITIEVVQPLAGPDITASVADGNITLGSSITLSGSVTQGKNPLYRYSYTVAPAGEIITTVDPTNNTITITPGTTGQYIVTLEVYNSVSPSVYKNFTFIVMVGVSGVTIDFTTSYPNAILRTSSITFSAVVAAGTDRLYSWNAILSNGTSVNVGNSDTFSVTFLVQDIYNITLQVKNYASSITVYELIHSLNEVPAFSITQAGATYEPDNDLYAIKTNQLGYFSQNVGDTSFLLFQWRLKGIATVTTAGYSYNFTAAGTYDIALNISNMLSYQIDRIQVVVQDELKNFSVSLCNATSVIGSVMTISATYQGTGVNVTWSIKDQPNTFGNNIIFSYPYTGIYSMNVTAKNYVSSQTLHCFLNMQGLISDLVLERSQFNYVGYPVTFTVTGNYIDPATFTWTFSDGTTKTTTTPSVDHIFTTDGSHLVTVNVANEVSSESASLNVDIEALKCGVPSITVDGNSERTVRRSRPFELTVNVEVGNCNDYTSKNEWLIYSATSCEAALVTSVPLASSIMINTPTLKFPKHTLAVGTYCVLFNHIYEGTPVLSTAKFNVTVVKSRFFAVLNGNDFRMASAGPTLTLDARGTSDPDDDSGTMMNYQWTCTQSMGTTSAAQVCSAIRNVQASHAELTGLTLSTNDEYQISMTVYASGRENDTAYQIIHIVDTKVPIFDFSCVSCEAANLFYFVNSGGISLQSNCTFGCTPSSTYKWTVMDVTTSSVITIPSSHTKTGLTSANFVLKSSALQENKAYKFQLEVTENGQTGISFATFNGVSKPSFGSCDVNPSNNIVPLTHIVTVSCNGVTEDDSLSSIYYKIVISSATSTDDGYIAYYGTKASNQLYVVPSKDGDVNIRLYAVNDYGAEQFLLLKTIQFTDPTLSSGTKIDYMIDRMRSQMKIIAKKNSPSEMLQYCLALVNYLNRLSEESVGTASQRMALRDVIITSLDGLPLTSNIQQMASALDLLVEQPSELSSTTIETVLAAIESLKDKLESFVVIGMNQDDIKPDYLISAINKIQTALDSTIITTSNTTVLAMFHPKEEYILSISSSLTKTTYSSESARVLALTSKAIDSSVQLLIVSLTATLAGEDQQLHQFSDGSSVVARHVPTSQAHKNFQLPGMLASIGQGAMNHIGFTDASLYQYAMISSINPYQAVSTSSSVNTLVLTFALHNTLGDQLDISNMPEGSDANMYIFASEANSFEINEKGLINSNDYNPQTDMLYSSMVLSSTTSYGVNINHPEADDVSIHIQVRADFTDSDQILKATLQKNNAPYTFENGSKYELIINQTMMNNTKTDHRLYTFFLESSAISPDDAISVKLKSSGSSKNLSTKVGVYHSKCVFYDDSGAKWSTAGCVPKDESIATVILCRCNHTTSFGGSLLVSPDQLDFTDLSQVDFSSNPVAIITCSVILFMYIVLAVAFKRMDIMDLKRISLIPLCGKDGSFKYEVTVVTGRLPRAGTTAHVGIRLIGEYGKSVRQHVSKPGAFQRNCSDTFIVAYDVNLGDLRKIQIWHDNSGTSPSWYLGHVIVNDLQTDKKYYFFGDTWLTLEDENGTIQKEIKVAGSHELTKFTHRMKTAAFNALADKHLWLSLFNRPAQSRFTRAQRVTCCVTVLYVFVGVNAMWYGLLKKSNTELGFGDFGWEELVLALVSNIMVLPISIGLVFLFKKSRSKPNFFAHVHKPQTAQTLEIENLCGNSQGGSFESDNTGAVPYDLERESTIDSVPRTALGLHRSRHVAKTHRENTDDSLMQKRPSVSVTQASSKSPLWNEDGIMKWPDSVPGFDDGQDSRPSTCSTMASVPAVRQPPKAGGSTPGPARKTKKGEAVQLLEELDKLEQDLKENESQSGRSGSRRTSTQLRRPTMHKSSWGSLEDILNSDDESVADSSRLKKRGSTASQSTMKKFNPRADPRIHGNGHDWPKSRESINSASSAAQPVTAALRPGYYSEMTMESRDIHLPEHKEKCTLPPWCIYIGYTLCFILSVFSVIIVILYCFKFGYDESVEWVLALILSLILSIVIIEPLKALLIAVYVVAMFKNVEQDEDEDFIDIEPTYDSSNEKIKDVKFKPISGFALLQAKEEGRKIHRMKIMIRQFIAYIFYLWLIMVIVYINFRYDSYLMTKHVEHDIIAPTTANHQNFTNITSIDEFWDWTENVFVGAIHKENLTDEEHGLLLGAPRLRLIRGLTGKCEATTAANNLGAPSLTQRTCNGEGTYHEDTRDYSEGWNESNSNYSWKYYGAGALGSTHKVGHVATYGGGGYPQVLGTTMAETDTIISYLKDKSWIDLQTRAIIFEFALYSAGSDMTSMVALLAEFPLTGGVITSYEIQSQKLLWFQSGSVEPQMVLEIILFLVIIYSVVHISLQIREYRKQFFKEIWNWYEMLTTLMALVSVGIYIGCVVEATNAFNNFLDDLTGFTNFERAMYVHIAMRYLHAWLLFLLMFKVVKQLRFIKFMFKYEQTLSKALGHLLGSGLIYVILLVAYALVGYSMYGRIVSGFESVGHSIVTLVVMIRGTFDFWPMLDHHPVFSHFYVYSYYAFAYGILMGLVISILTSTYKVVRSQMYYTSTLEMQDYEMIEFMMKRFKLWAGFQKPKPAFRRVRFPGLPSISSRSSSSYSNRSEVSLQSSHSLTGPQYSEIQLRCMLTRLQPTWQAVLKRMDKILALDDEEENLVKRAENEMKDLNWKCRINELERQHKELLSWKDQSQSSGSSKPPIGDAKQRQSILKRLARKDNHDRQAPATVTGAQSRTAASTPNEDNSNGEARQSRRPLSDQGARVEPSTSKGRSSSSDKSKLQTFLKSIKPSKSAWNK